MNNMTSYSLAKTNITTHPLGENCGIKVKRMSEKKSGIKAKINKYLF